MKFLRFFLVIVILIGVLMGCTEKSDQSDETGTLTQSATGGVAEPAENINLKSIGISMDGDDAVLTLSLLSGSREAGYAESKLTVLPEYEITQLSQPQRLMIKLDNISFWDYEEDAWELPDFIAGIFREVPADDDSLILYVQLLQNVSFSVEEAEGNLVVRITLGTENESAKYYCVSDSFYEHQEGKWPDSVDMSPVLCSDLENKLLISEPFDTQEEADAFMETASTELEAFLPDNSIYVIELEKDALPEYSSDIDYSSVNDRNIVVKDDVLVDTPVLLQNGRYLATASDGRIAFSRRYEPEDPELVEDIDPLSEQLWILDPNGRIQNIDVLDFYSIDQAAFSADGRYICILDVSIENRVLYVYDFQTEEPLNLGEEGFGSQTAAFAWSDTGNTLYAMTGYSSMQMMSCTFAEDGTMIIAAVEEEAGSEGKLAVSQGRLFFADNYAGYSGKIYEIGDSRREITEGLDFAISPDGTTMLVLEAASTDGEEVLTSLKLCDIETGETTVEIVNDRLIENFCFSQNGRKIYYTDELVDEEDATSNAVISGYSHGLYSYDIISGTRQLIAWCSTGYFAPSTESGQIYFIEYIENSDNDFYATYVYDLSS